MALVSGAAIIIFDNADEAKLTNAKTKAGRWTQVGSGGIFVTTYFASPFVSRHVYCCMSNGEMNGTQSAWDNTVASAHICVESDPRATSDRVPLRESTEVSVLQVRSNWTEVPLSQTNVVLKPNATQAVCVETELGNHAYYLPSVWLENQDWTAADFLTSLAHKADDRYGGTSVVRHVFTIPCKTIAIIAPSSLSTTTHIGPDYGNSSYEERNLVQRRAVYRPMYQMRTRHQPVETTRTTAAPRHARRIHYRAIANNSGTEKSNNNVASNRPSYLSSWVQEHSFDKAGAEEDGKIKDYHLVRPTTMRRMMIVSFEPRTIADGIFAFYRWWFDKTTGRLAYMVSFDDETSDDDVPTSSTRREQEVIVNKERGGGGGGATRPAVVTYDGTWIRRYADVVGYLLQNRLDIDERVYTYARLHGGRASNQEKTARVMFLTQLYKTLPIIGDSSSSRESLRTEILSLVQTLLAGRAHVDTSDISFAAPQAVIAIAKAALLFPDAEMPTTTTTTIEPVLTRGVSNVGNNNNNTSNDDGAIVGLKNLAQRARDDFLHNVALPYHNVLQNVDNGGTFAANWWMQALQNKGNQIVPQWLWDECIDSCRASLVSRRSITEEACALTGLHAWNPNVANLASLSNLLSETIQRWGVLQNQWRHEAHGGFRYYESQPWYRTDVSTHVLEAVHPYV